MIANSKSAKRSNIKKAYSLLHNYAPSILNPFGADISPTD